MAAVVTPGGGRSWRAAVAVALRDPRVRDWLPVVVLPPILIADGASSGHPVTAVAVLAVIAGCLPLVVRSRVPFALLTPVIVGAIVLVLWRMRPANTVVLIPMVALFEMALSGDRRRSLWLALVTPPAVLVSVVPFRPGSDLPSILVRNSLLCLLAIAAGDALRSRGAAAQRAAAVREEETQRRIGEERLRIAREVHDVVAHAMTAINVQAGVAAHLLARDPDQAYDALRHIKHTSGEALADLRATLEVLRDPAQVAPLGPGSDLADLTALTAGLEAAGVAVHLDLEPIGEVPASVQRAVYRIVQEALTNVMRHAGAGSARVRVHRRDGAVSVEVIDDGRGAAIAAGGGTGNGLRGMRERAAALGGTAEAAAQPAGGWRVAATLPVPES